MIESVSGFRCPQIYVFICGIISNLPTLPNAWGQRVHQVTPLPAPPSNPAALGGYARGELFDLFDCLIILLLRVSAQRPLPCGPFIRWFKPRSTRITRNRPGQPPAAQRREAEELSSGRKLEDTSSRPPRSLGHRPSFPLLLSSSALPRSGLFRTFSGPNHGRHGPHRSHQSACGIIVSAKREALLLPQPKLRD